MLIPWSNKQLDMVFSTCVCVCVCVGRGGGAFSLKTLKIANEVQTHNMAFLKASLVCMYFSTCCNPPTCCYGNIPTCCCSEVSPVSGRAPAYDGIPPPPPPGTCVLVAMGAPHPPLTCWACCWNGGGYVWRGRREYVAYKLVWRGRNEMFMCM